MPVYAHLLDIAYCVTKFNQLEPPFQCDMSCEEFGGMELVYQWYFDDAVCGYIAKTKQDIFKNGTLSSSSKTTTTIVVGLRGTRSFGDSFADLQVDMVNYNLPTTYLPPCSGCKVHKGFMGYATKTIGIMEAILIGEVKKAMEDGGSYQVIVVGHSLGGAIALLVALRILDLSYNNLMCVTFGQPLVGNQNFVQWTDYVMQSMESDKLSSSRKFYRVIHKNDMVTTVPNNDQLLINTYKQFLNQIYLNCSNNDILPLRDQVVDCGFGDNPLCISKDVPIGHNYMQSHLTYFRHMGLCGIQVPTLKQDSIL
ncbi:uncharacterized protein KQ657_003091 [Scheffersomyces spartinae]|uniref:triacylglycerol lipase n=1 Tax=Scheffersomyces spartinae TaxID=45513 RepID=A0A9P7V522_9ASCO|nr:uncharacterized protein KQ657_003091 [Scheffersomyces spartinae]KAG7191496.1 hypothetical protein KQ657_003091 [Scheffersomyces spartinae]